MSSLIIISVVHDWGSVVSIVHGEHDRVEGGHHQVVEVETRCNIFTCVRV
jgi:hypothetical protein